MKERVEIQEFTKEFYDEESEALLMNISTRKFCFRHDFINASLFWSDQKNHYAEGAFHISIQSDKKENFNPEWGTGYGGIRYCRKCKFIDCIHLWKESKVYEVKHGDFSSTCYSVSECRVCRKRIRRSGWGESKPSQEGHEICMAAAKKLGMTYEIGHFGSMWFCEFPVRVSEIHKAQGLGAAVKYAEDTFRSGCLR